MSDEFPGAFPRSSSKRGPSSPYPGPLPAPSGVAGNARLTGSTAAVLFVLLAIEGYSIAVGVGAHLTLHVYVGLLLIPPVLLKCGSTIYRFLRYYAGAPAYRRKGPPPVILRVLGPALILLSVALFASGVALLFASPNSRSTLDQIHRLSFIAWLVVASIHVIGHLRETAHLAPRDLYWRTRRQVRGAGARQWALASSLALGVLLAELYVGRAAHYFGGFGGYHLKP